MARRLSNSLRSLGQYLGCGGFGVLALPLNFDSTVLDNDFAALVGGVDSGTPVRRRLARSESTDVLLVGVPRELRGVVGRLSREVSDAFPGVVGRLPMPCMRALNLRFVECILDETSR